MDLAISSCDWPDEAITAISVELYSLPKDMIMPKNKLIGIIYIEYWVILTKIIGNSRYVGKDPTEASSINLSIVFDDNIIINIAKTAREDPSISLSKYLSRIFILSYLI